MSEEPTGAQTTPLAKPAKAAKVATEDAALRETQPDLAKPANLANSAEVANPAEDSAGSQQDKAAGNVTDTVAPKLIAPAGDTLYREPSAPSAPPNSRSPLISDSVRAKIEAIEAEARALGWPAELLWSNVFWGSPRGLAACLDASDEIVEVTADYIAIRTGRDLQRFYRHVGGNGAASVTPIAEAQTLRETVEQLWITIQDHCAQLCEGVSPEVRSRLQQVVEEYGRFVAEQLKQGDCASLHDDLIKLQRSIDELRASR